MLQGLVGPGIVKLHTLCSYAPQCIHTHTRLIHPQTQIGYIDLFCQCERVLQIQSKDDSRVWFDQAILLLLLLLFYCNISIYLLHSIKRISLDYFVFSFPSSPSYDSTGLFKTSFIPLKIFSFCSDLFSSLIKSTAKQSDVCISIYKKQFI